MIVIGRLHGGPVEPRFWTSYEQLQKPDHLPIVIERLHVDRARNEVVDMTLNPEVPRPPQYPGGVDKRYKDATHVFFIDDDMVVPPGGLLRLLSHNVPIVGGLYYGRIPPHLPVVYRHVEDNQWVPVTEFCAGLQEVDAIGAGFLLIQREVLEKMARPWFEFSDKMGEDMYFCEEARKLGYKILLDADIKCGHLSMMEITEAHFLAHKAQGLTFQEHPSKDLATLSREVRPYRPAAKSLLRLVK